MESPQDTPLKRFSAFWIGLILLVSFALIGLVFALFDKSGTSDIEAVAAEDRHAIHERVISEQAAALNPEAMDKARQAMLKTLLTSAPEKGSMPVATDPQKEADAAENGDDAETNSAEVGEKEEAAPATEPVEETSTQS